MKKYRFQVNKNKYILLYTKEQKEKIDYMNDWKNIINILKYKIKNNKNVNFDTCYISKTINNYNFTINHLLNNMFIIRSM